MADIIDTLTKIFTDYGWQGLAMIVGAAIIILIINFIIKKKNAKSESIISGEFKKLTENITTQNNNLVTILSEQVSSNKEIITSLIDNIDNLIDKAMQNRDNKLKVEHEKSMKQRMEVSTVICQKIHDMLVKYNCDRVCILEFHNGSQNITGLPFLKYSILYEEISKGMSNIRYTYQKQDAMTLMPIINAVNENNGYKIYNLNDLEDMESYSSILYRNLRVEQNLTEATFIGLYGINNNLLGMLVLEYIDNIVPVEVFDINEIIAESLSIATMLDYENKNN